MAALLLRGQAVVPMQLVARVPVALFYWPLIQLASAAIDNIALGVSVGSKGRGNIPGATSDIRATLVLLLVGKCTAEPAAFLEVGGDDFFRELLDDTDSRVAYYSSTFLLKRMTEEPESYQRMLSSLVYRARQETIPTAMWGWDGGSWEIGGWHWLVLKNGVEVKLQRKALSVLEHPTGNK